MTSKSPSGKGSSAVSVPMAYGLGIFAVVVFGSTLPVTTLALNEFGPGFITFARALIAALMACACIAWLQFPFRHPNQLPIFIAGVLLIYGFPGFMALAMQTVPASHGGVVLGFLPLATALVARLIGNESPSPKFWLLSAVGFLIVAVYALYHGANGGTPTFETGDLWLLFAGLSASTGYVIFGKLSRNTPGWEIICRALLLNLPITLIGSIWFYTPDVLQASTQGLLALAYLGAFSMFLGFCGWNVALAIGGIARIGQLQLFQIFVTLGVSAFLLSESIDFVTISAAIAITTIVALSREG